MIGRVPRRCVCRGRKFSAENFLRFAPSGRRNPDAYSDGACLGNGRTLYDRNAFAAGGDAGVVRLSDGIEFDGAIRECEKGVVFADRHIFARNDACPALAHDNLAFLGHVAISDFDTEILRL